MVGAEAGVRQDAFQAQRHWPRSQHFNHRDHDKTVDAILGGAVLDLRLIGALGLHASAQAPKPWAAVQLTRGTAAALHGRHGQRDQSVLAKGANRAARSRKTV
jgi:hypothetical protein